MTSRTFDEWKALGYVIKKGSKSEVRSGLGVPLFTESQVEKAQRRGRMSATGGLWGTPMYDAAQIAAEKALAAGMDPFPDDDIPF